MLCSVEWKSGQTMETLYMNMNVYKYDCEFMWRAGVDVRKNADNVENFRNNMRIWGMLEKIVRLRERENERE